MNTENTNVETTTEAAPAKPAPREIIRGRMPVAIVYLVHYLTPHIESNGAKAKAFGTTIGKIADIMNVRNFGYVTEDFRPTEAQKAEGKAWLEKHPEGAAELIELLEGLEVATAEQAAAFDALRASMRAKPLKGESDPVAPPADGGGKKGRGKSKSAPEAAPADSGTTADALLD